MPKVVLGHAKRPDERVSPDREYRHRAEASEGEAARRLLESHGFVMKKKTNGQYEFPCPFHQDPGEVPRNVSADFYVDVMTSRYICHSAKCGQRGNLVTLERHFGIAPEDVPAFETRENKLKGYQANLTPERRKVFYDHGLNDDTIDRFRLGWEPDMGCYVIPYLEGTRPVAFRYYDPTCTVGPNGSKYWWEKGSTARLFNDGDVVGDDKHRVFICEGEQKAMLLWQLGYAAVATPGASIFKDEWFRYFNDAHEIYVCYDNDNPAHHDYGVDCRICPSDCEGHNPGQEQAEKLVNRLGWRAKNIVLPLPDPEARKTDINEFFVRDGATASDFAEMALGEAKQPYVVSTLAEIAASPPDETNFLIEQGILPQAGRLLIAGKPKVGKSIFAENLALSLAAGIPFLNRFKPDHPTRVLLLDRELSKRSLFERLMALSDYRPGYRAAWDNLCVDHDMMVKIDQPDAYEKLHKLVKHNGVEVIMLDTAYKFVTGDLESSTRMSKAFDVLDKLIHETGVAIVLTHHIRKSQGNSAGKNQDSPDPDNVAGSFLWTGWPNATILLTYLNRSVQDPFNSVCHFTSFRDHAPPDPVALYRDRESIGYSAISDYHYDEDSGTGSFDRDSTPTKPTTESVQELLLELVPCTEDDFLRAASNFFHVKPSTIRPYMLDALLSDFFEKSDGRPPVIRYKDPVKEESWEAEHKEQLRLIQGG